MQTSLFPEEILSYWEDFVLYSATLRWNRNFLGRKSKAGNSSKWERERERKDTETSKSKSTCVSGFHVGVGRTLIIFTCSPHQNCLLFTCLLKSLASSTHISLCPKIYILKQKNHKHPHMYTCTSVTGSFDDGNDGIFY